MSINRLQRIEALLMEMPDDVELRYMLAMEHASAGDDVRAVACFQDLIQRQADYPPAYHQGGRALQRLGRFDEACDLLARGVTVANLVGNAHAAGEMSELLSYLRDAAVQGF